MWPHFVNLLAQSWHSFRDSLGTTTLGFIAPLVVSVLSIVLTLYSILRQHGKDAMLKHWKEDAKIAVRVTVIVTVLVYGPILFYEGLVKSVFDDHQSLVSTNAHLNAQTRDLSTRLIDAQESAEQRCEQTKGDEIKRLKRQLNAACYRPDRHLTNEDRAVIFAALQRIVEEQKKKNLVPIIRLMCGCQDNEVSRFTNDELWPIFRNAGWTILVDTPSEKLTAEQITKKFESQRAWIYQAGFAEGITVFDKDAKGSGWGLSMPFYERGYGGMWDQRHTELPNIDGLTIWVGYKSTR